MRVRAGQRRFVASPGAGPYAGPGPLPRAAAGPAHGATCGPGRGGGKRREAAAPTGTAKLYRPAGDDITFGFDAHLATKDTMALGAPDQAGEPEV
ncbi:hypothetical protein [Streptomyces sp. NBC_01431]|uniref:hypothetical protein n=1 Tax=Streptomyces sp. NBC_01431 TaxID=2903863 RepID=UPI003FCE1191